MRLTRLAVVPVLAMAAGCGGSGGGPPAVEHCYPHMADPEPKGTLPAGTAVVTLRMTTDREAQCRYSSIEGLRYVELEHAFAQTGGLVHTTPVTGLDPGNYRLFAKCEVVVDRDTDCSTPHDLVFLFSLAAPGAS